MGSEFDLFLEPNQQALEMTEYPWSPSMLYLDHDWQHLMCAVKQERLDGVWLCGSVFVCCWRVHVGAGLQREPVGATDLTSMLWCKEKRGLKYYGVE